MTTDVMDPPASVPFGQQAIPGFPDFYVTTEGEVYSLRGGPRRIGNWTIEIPRLVPQSTAGRDYRRVSLWSNGKTHSRYLHELVASAFVPGKAPGLQVRHWDGIKENNRADNLIWGTAKENGADSIRQGLTTRGERNAMAKLTAENVIEIRRLLREGNLSQRQIGERFGVQQTLISLINTGKIWGHLEARS